MSRASVGALHLPNRRPLPPDFIHEYARSSASMFLGASPFLRHGESRYDPPHEGPWTSVCLDGFDIEWPSYLILEEQACLKRWGEILRQYVEVAEVGPLDPVELLFGLPEQDLMLLQAA